MGVLYLTLESSPFPFQQLLKLLNVLERMQDMESGRPEFESPLSCVTFVKLLLLRVSGGSVG